MARYSETQVGKRVVDAAGVDVGTVDRIDDGDLIVRVGPDADRETLSELGWDGTVNQQVHRLRGRYVSNISEEVVRLRV